MSSVKPTIPKLPHCMKCPDLEGVVQQVALTSAKTPAEIQEMIRAGKVTLTGKAIKEVFRALGSSEWAYNTTYLQGNKETMQQGLLAILTGKHGPACAIEGNYFAQLCKEKREAEEALERWEQQQLLLHADVAVKCETSAASVETTSSTGTAPTMKKESGNANKANCNKRSLEKETGDDEEHVHKKETKMSSSTTAAVTAGGTVVSMSSVKPTIPKLPHCMKCPDLEGVVQQVALTSAKTPAEIQEMIRAGKVTLTGKAIKEVFRALGSSEWAYNTTYLQGNKETMQQGLLAILTGKHGPACAIEGNYFAQLCKEKREAEEALERWEQQQQLLHA